MKSALRTRQAGKQMSPSAKQLTARRQQGFEKAKDKRRKAILEACERLIRETGSTDFSMKELATAAGISTYTTYNLIGSKATVFYVLLNRGIDQIDVERLLSGTHPDPFQRVFDAGLAVANVFASDPEFYRPLMRYLLGVLDPVNRPDYMSRAFDYWHQAVQPIADADLLRHGMSASSLARNLQVFFTGAIDYWVHGELSGEELRAQVRYGVAVHLLALAQDDRAAGLQTIIAGTESVITTVAMRQLHTRV